MMRTFRRTALVVALAAVIHGSSALKCVRGWGGSMSEIPEELINDNYCDCPFDGADEPNTEACAGSAIWPGIHQKPVDNNEASHHLFQCPQQPKKQLPLSRINDGICDCCDGADEKEGVCPDICDEVLAAERAAQAKTVHDYQIGSQQRQAELQRFQELVQFTMAEIQETERELQGIEQEKGTMEEWIASAKQKQAEERFKVTKEIVEGNPMWVEYFQHLTTDELFSLIMFACQLAGEQDDAAKEKTCIPLRLAGIDMGILWDEQKDAGEIKASLQPNEEQQKVLAELIDQHSLGDTTVWSLKNIHKPKKKNHENERKHHRPMDDDEYFDDYDEERYPDDDYMYNDEEDAHAHHYEKDVDESSEEGKADGEQNNETREMVKGLALSDLRLVFLDHSMELVSRIDGLLAVAGDDEDDVDGGENQDKDDSMAAAKDVDPMALSLIRNKLKRLQGSIERGLDYGASAAELLRALNRACEESGTDQLQSLLAGLTIGTLYHGKISAQNLWQMSVMILPEFEFESCTNEDTCEADTRTFDGYLGRVCPARTIERNATPFPPKPILSAGQALCEEWLENPPASACPSESDAEVPTSIPEGYCGYLPSQPRDGEDILNPMFAQLGWLATSHLEIGILEEKRDELEKKRKELSGKVHEMEERIGGREQTKFGTNGELYSFRDTCLSAEAGKYVYEACFFGKATQRDRDDEGGRGTDLGKWKGITIDEETGTRTLKWEGGTKCWNGPQRSVTAIVRCGAETKVHKAEEPDTCRYELEMESHMACDDAYKEHAGL